MEKLIGTWVQSPAPSTEKEYSSKLICTGICAYLSSNMSTVLTFKQNNKGQRNGKFFLFPVLNPT